MAATAQRPTTVIQEIRAVFTDCMFAQMADVTLARHREDALRAPTAAEAQLAIARFTALSGEIRGAAILAPDGSLAAASGDAEDWREAARGLLAAADSATGREASHAHVATEEGEVYAVRSGGLAMVAVTERFTLASLVLSDMRAALRSLAAGAEPSRAEAG